LFRIQNGHQSGLGASHWARNVFPPKATKAGGFLTEKAALKRNSAYKKNVTTENKLKAVY
jgi:hypothetical protein